MARRPAQKDQIVALRQRIERTRFDMGRVAIDVRNRYDLPARLRGSMRRHPLGWFFGSMGAGLVGALSFGRRRKRGRDYGGEHGPPARRGAMLVGAAGFLVSVLKPVARRWLTRQFLGRP